MSKHLLNHKVTQVLGARMQVIEKTLDLAEAELTAAIKAGLVSLSSRHEGLVENAQKDLDTLRDLMSEYLETQTEWQVSAFHDQYTALSNRLTANRNMMPKEAQS